MIACAEWLGRTSETCTRKPDGCACAEDELATSITAAMEAAKTRMELIKASQQIEHVQGFSRCERLAKVFKRRYDELKTTH